MNIAFDKTTGLVPAIIQDATTLQVLMLGYMNQEALDSTLKEKKVYFYSRSRQKLWLKGETSGAFLHLESVEMDCDQDALLVRVRPESVVCHTGSFSCFGEKSPKGFLYGLEATIRQRLENGSDSSYTRSLVEKGINKVAQKVGEEAVELVIEAKDNNRELFLGEAADLLYHTLILLAAKGEELQSVEKVLLERSKG
ncbi:bifunctional phosphoribosyl-AMP cyclohydrolase/phosphoribosyl-ATP diphosphatase HisIE [Planobacterium oryzisoli]|uniref:Histidine biosynthesis bifunctional protein HisIE n=1 Tax=Planobacterium oryzisoli TaxID=2771435 RepID=A0A931E615_9FLAO|nr:bifunctional phosphoribosyl-AMP cyclohydrolase/phosphoribosyl-ATP diphosphatase HisIE [Planobacterium oryzisoli]MBF5027350.1 bifunctional phosphoribosyl-AMP cyclohydrolase/phosphoribosyl-ATP diphosphatase HisIE [Planobacterium oryzisoli]